MCKSTAVCVCAVGTLLAICMETTVGGWVNVRIDAGIAGT